MEQTPKFSKVLLFLLVLFGLGGGFGIFTFFYANGPQHLTKDPEACKNCHVMEQVYESWMKGGHQHAAVCIDCHMPKDFIAKWFAKAKYGYMHGYAFTFLQNPVSYTASDEQKGIIQNNCIHCHKDYAANSLDAKAKAAHGNSPEPLNCVSCHRQVGHAHNF
ncbi:MAG: cytochrome c nitrite reductase small subunit [Campylobacter sp.]|nr:cytochrome c nitrite reductase small subunit [Campylobacter sp.]